MLNKYKIIPFVLVFFVIVGCASNGNTEPTNGDHVDDGDEALLVSPNNLLGFKLLEQVEPEEGNIFISPLSAFIAVMLVYNGADGDTKQEMAEALHLEDDTLEEVNSAMYALTNSLIKDVEDIDLTIANSIWLNDQLHYHENYAKAVENYFAAQHETINIEEDTSVDRMNAWVSEATNDKITDMVEKPLSQDFIAMILNAIYFNGKWQYEFDEANTSEATFYTGDDDMTVPFMMLEEELAYSENEMFQAVQLPYGTGEMNAQIFLPNEEIDMETFLGQLTEENWTSWQADFQQKTGVVKLPRFQIEYETSLHDAFQHIGMKRAFNKGDAEFPHLIQEDEQMYIHGVKQKTYIDVTEEGTEAAGVTSVEIRTTSAVIEEDNFHMEINRPFFFTITDEETNAILFMGIIKNPKQGS